MHGVFRTGEIRAIEICATTYKGDELEPAQDVLELTVTVGPQLQTFGATVWHSVVMAEWTTDQMRQRLRDDLMDFVSGSSWGGANSEACPGHRTLPFLGVSG